MTGTLLAVNNVSNELFRPAPLGLLDAYIPLAYVAPAYVARAMYASLLYTTFNINGCR